MAETINHGFKLDYWCVLYSTSLDCETTLPLIDAEAPLEKLQACVPSEEMAHSKKV